jgi:hypothetical protein
VEIAKPHDECLYEKTVDMIYFIQEGNAGPIKIGFAIDPWKRIEQIQIGNSEKLNMLRTIPGNKKREREIHKLLSAYKKRGEWYEPTIEVIEFIKGLDELEYEVMDLRAYAVIRRDTENSETDYCPFCGKKHRHGKGDGHRGVHCSSPAAREEVQAGNVTLRKSDGYIIRTRWK